LHDYAGERNLLPDTVEELGADEEVIAK